jgi:hypothetical protein
LIEKFNFYDIYGYFFPGCAMLGLLWLPFAWVAWPWPKLSSWVGAAVAIIAAYILGHLVQTIANHALPSAAKGRAGALATAGRGESEVKKNPWRQPSSILLDAGDSAFVSRLTSLVKESFQIDVSGSGTGNTQDVDARRGEAFLLCRAVLVEARVAAYVEQFEGMYTLMRGLSLAFFFGAAYLAGWALSQFRFGCSKPLAAAAAVVLIGVCVLVSYAAAPFGGRHVPSQRRMQLDWWAGTLVGAALLALGYLLGVAAGSAPHRLVFLAAMLVALFCAVRCYTAYHGFTWTYASEVWRGFVAHRVASSKFPT